MAVSQTNKLEDLKMSEQEKAQRQQIAQTIIQQMGGTGRLGAMIGANTYIALESGVQFNFKGSRSMNRCRVILDRGMDLYRMELYRVWNSSKRGPQCDLKYHLEGMYCDMLKPVFEQETGLYLSLS